MAAVKKASRMHPVEKIQDINDERITLFRDLPDRRLSAEGEYFIAEGELVLERLLSSGYRVESVLAVESRLDRVIKLIPPGVRVYSAPRQLVSRIIGFKFHLGVIGCGVRKPPLSLADMASGWQERVTLLVLPDIINTRNLGGLFRIAAGMGADGVLLGPRCCDPYYRQCLRVSMGGVFNVPFFRSEDLAGDLGRLQGQYGFENFATVVDSDARTLSEVSRPDRMAILFGSEAKGLSPELLSNCRNKVTIPMQLGTDSLNVAVSAGIILHYFQYLAGSRS